MTAPQPPDDNASGPPQNAPSPALLELFQQVAAGRLDAAAAAARASEQGLDPSAVAFIDGATVDLGRAARCGFGEVIYGEGKSAELIIDIAGRLIDQQREVLVTRCEPAVAEQVGRRFAHHRYARSARTLRLSRQPLTQAGEQAAQRAGERTGERAGERAAASTAEQAARPALPRVAVVCAGSTDLPVAREAAETLAWMGVAVDILDDIGVAGPQRLLAVVDRLRRAHALVVVAGMEGALPSVVAGHVAVPVVAVPTSVGYGAALSGWTALLGMLTSCASNVAVVNIDAGFKGGYVAGMIAHQSHRAEGVEA
ncbi:nickel pincer cofactor biosynthesis protein LarB [Roseimaritima sediminicola]|uniref:nickel pincer cofactor biosynthesis protein LarB n=1 Tax=Roseimaritima sediminicola TaxID=2662066 RepID=UPI00192A266B|nr:nickel pincer cofactor biosynthesis protein LarB [Roseimaritima sediminicola]